jgi:hypothetical protein
MIENLKSEKYRIIYPRLDSLKVQVEMSSAPWKNLDDEQQWELDCSSNPKSTVNFHRSGSLLT